MEANRPVVLTIAGFDPSGGAGILADIKTFEQHKVYGLGINTSLTLQTADQFISIRWETENAILQSLETMLENFSISVIKIGIVENCSRLKNIVRFINLKNKNIKIIIDPVIKSSSGFNFWNEIFDKEQLAEIFSFCFLITPNYEEATQLLPATDAKIAAQQLAQYCAILLKGGHNNAEPGVDFLYQQQECSSLLPIAGVVSGKHGSGCVLSAAITANIALGDDLLTACTKAKIYIEQFLSSNNTLLGYHHV